MDLVYLLAFGAMLGALIGLVEACKLLRVRP
jgi:hypothetical protein